MKKSFRAISAVLALAMAFSFTGCSQSTDDSSEVKTTEKAESTTTAADPILTGEKPELNILTLYQTYNFEEQPGFKLIQELTGYKIKYSVLPQENAVQKLLLEISSGADYDLLARISADGYSQLSAQKALINLNPLLEKYGSNITSAVSDLAWSAVTDDAGNTNAIPYENATADPEDPYGMLTGGIGVRSDMLEEMGLEVPTNLDDFTKMLEAAKAKYGVAPLTSSKAAVFSGAILSAFNLSDVPYIDGVYTARIKNENLPDYLAYMQKLYKEKLLDTDFPINTDANAKEKFASKNALACDPAYFWDIPSMKTALATSNPDCKMKIITALAKDSSSKAIVTLGVGIGGYFCVSQNAKNPEHAINYLNILSTKENFQKVYVGEEGKSFELKDGNYYPIFSETAGGFADYTNSDKMTGVVNKAESFKMWQARARKTPEMAEAYEEMNARVDDYEVKINIDSLGSSAPAVQKYSASLNTAFSDSFLKAIVDGTDPAKAVAEMRADWDKNGGLEMEKAMQEFYDKNKDFAG